MRPRTAEDLDEWPRPHQIIRTMRDRQTNRAVTDLAARVGAELPSQPRSALGRLFRRIWVKLVSKPAGTPVPAVLDTSADKPRDLDDPFSDPDTQRRIGLELAEKARNWKRHE